MIVFWNFFNDTKNVTVDPPWGCEAGGSFFVFFFSLFFQAADGRLARAEECGGWQEATAGLLRKRNRRKRGKEEEKEKKKEEKKGEISAEGRGDFAGAEDVRRGARDRERGPTGPTHQGFSLGSGMILIYFASPVLNCSPLFLVSVWIPLTFEDHLCNLFSVLGRLWVWIHHSTWFLETISVSFFWFHPKPILPGIACMTEILHQKFHSPFPTLCITSRTHP